MKTIQEMTDEVREVNIAKGWRDEPKTRGDFLALLHSELSEMLEAFRDHRHADATIPLCADETCPRFGKMVTALTCAQVGSLDRAAHRTMPGKPEGVGSEAADVLIRLLDMCDVHGLTVFDMDMELGDVASLEGDRVRGLVTFGDWVNWLHDGVAYMSLSAWNSEPVMLRSLVTFAERWRIDLDAEYTRKIAYNRTRPYQHGGRTVADA